MEYSSIFAITCWVVIIYESKLKFEVLWLKIESRKNNNPKTFLLSLRPLTKSNCESSFLIPLLAFDLLEKMIYSNLLNEQMLIKLKWTRSLSWRLTHVTKLLGEENRVWNLTLTFDNDIEFVYSSSLLIRAPVFFLSNRVVNKQWRTNRRKFVYRFPYFRSKVETTIEIDKTTSAWCGHFHLLDYLWGFNIECVEWPVGECVESHNGQLHKQFIDVLFNLIVRN